MKNSLSYQTILRSQEQFVRWNVEKWKLKFSLQQSCAGLGIRKSVHSETRSKVCDHLYRCQCTNTAPMWHEEMEISSTVWMENSNGSCFYCPHNDLSAALVSFYCDMFLSRFFDATATPVLVITTHSGPNSLAPCEAFVYSTHKPPNYEYIHVHKISVNCQRLLITVVSICASALTPLNQTGWGLEKAKSVTFRNLIYVSINCSAFFLANAGQDCNERNEVIVAHQR